MEAYGASHTLQEILTVKSDDVMGRVKTYEAIVKGENIPEPGVPESFKVLIKELQSLALDVKVLSEENQEIHIKETVDDDLEDLSVNIEGKEDEEQEAVYQQEHTDTDDEEDVELDDLDIDDFDDDIEELDEGLLDEDLEDVKDIDDLDDLDDLDDFADLDDLDDSDDVDEDNIDE